MQFGRFAEARELLEKAAALTSPRHDEPHLFSHGSNPGIFCQSYLAHVLAFMGHADEALKTVEGNLAIARERARDPSHLYSYVDALAFAGRVHALLGNSSAVKLLSHELLAISRRNHYAYFEAIGTIQGGWALAKEGSLPLGIRQMREGVAALEQTGTGLGARGFYVQIAEFHVQLGEKQEALAMLDMARGRRDGEPAFGMRRSSACAVRLRRCHLKPILMPRRQAFARPCPSPATRTRGHWRSRLSSATRAF